jgi:hypothetical protein
VILTLTKIITWSNYFFCTFFVHHQSQEILSPAGTMINFALNSSRAGPAGAMLTRKKGNKKCPRSSAFESSTTSFRVQTVLSRVPAETTALPTPQTPLNTLEFEDLMDTAEMPIGSAVWKLPQESFDNSGPSHWQCVHRDFLVH